MKKIKSVFLTTIGFAVYLLVNIAFIIEACCIFVLTIFSKNLRKRIISKLLKWHLYFLTIFYLQKIGIYDISLFGDINKLPPQAIYITNHRSMLDPLWILALVPKCTTVVKKEYSSWLGAWALTRMFDFIEVEEGNRQLLTKSLEKAKGVIAEGYSITICPEGSRSPNLRLGEFKKLAFKLSKETNLPIIPVVLSSKNPLLSKDIKSYFFAEKNKVVIDFLDPIFPEDYKTAEILLSTSHRKISSKLSQYDKNFKKEKDND